MPELKHIRVRKGTPRDRGLFKKLWMKFLEEQHAKNDAEPLPTEENLEFYTRLFDLYTSGEHEGVVLFVADVAVSMWGDPISYLQFKRGQPAQCYGIYVELEHRQRGISNAMKDEGLKIIADAGFEWCWNSYLVGDEVAKKNLLGGDRKMHEVQTTGYWVLKE